MPNGVVGWKKVFIAETKLNTCSIMILIIVEVELYGVVGYSLTLGWVELNHVVGYSLKMDWVELLLDWRCIFLPSELWTRKTGFFLKRVKEDERNAPVVCSLVISTLNSTLNSQVGFFQDLRLFYCAVAARNYRFSARWICLFSCNCNFKKCNRRLTFIM